MKGVTRGSLWILGRILRMSWLLSTACLIIRWVRRVKLWMEWTSVLSPMWIIRLIQGFSTTWWPELILSPFYRRMSISMLMKKKYFYLFISCTNHYLSSFHELPLLYSRACWGRKLVSIFKFAIHRQKLSTTGSEWRGLQTFIQKKNSTFASKLSQRTS